MQTVARYCVGLLPAVTAACLASAACAETAPLRVTMFSGPQDLAVFVALEQGFYAKRGLAVEVTLTPNSQALRDGMANGSFDIASSGVDNAVYVADTGKADVAIVAGMRVRAAHERGVQKVGQMDIVDEAAAAAQQRRILDSLHAGSEHPPISPEDVPAGKPRQPVAVKRLPVVGGSACLASGDAVSTCFSAYR